jgi:hypothetical protein
MAVRADACSAVKSGNAGSATAGDAARQARVVQLAQLGRQDGQRQFAHPALVVGGGKVHQGPPLGTQRRQGGQRLVDGLQLGRRGLAVLRPRPDQPGHLAPAQGHAHQRAGRQGFRVAVVQQPAHGRVARRFHRDSQIQQVGHRNMISGLGAQSRLNFKEWPQVHD